MKTEEQYQEEYNRIRSVCDELRSGNTNFGQTDVYKKLTEILNQERAHDLHFGLTGSGKTYSVLIMLNALKYILDDKITIALTNVGDLSLLSESISLGLKHNVYKNEVKGQIKKKISSFSDSQYETDDEIYLRKFNIDLEKTYNTIVLVPLQYGDKSPDKLPSWAMPVVIPMSDFYIKDILDILVGKDDATTQSFWISMMKDKNIAEAYCDLIRTSKQGEKIQTTDVMGIKLPVGKMAVGKKFDGLRIAFKTFWTQGFVTDDRNFEFSMYNVVKKLVEKNCNIVLYTGRQFVDNAEMDMNDAISVLFYLDFMYNLKKVTEEKRQYENPMYVSLVFIDEINNLLRSKGKAASKDIIISSLTNQLGSAIRQWGHSGLYSILAAQQPNNLPLSITETCRDVYYHPNATKGYSGFVYNTPTKDMYNFMSDISGTFRREVIQTILTTTYSDKYMFVSVKEPGEDKVQPVYSMFSKTLTGYGTKAKANIQELDEKVYRKMTDITPLKRRLLDERASMADWFIEQLETPEVE